MDRSGEKIVHRRFQKVVSWRQHVALLTKPLSLSPCGVSGRGKWKEIASNIPSRSTIQTKTHAICFIKRIEAGEDVYCSALQRSANQLDSDDQFNSIPDCILRKYEKLSKEEKGLVVLLSEMRNSNPGLKANGI